jgi:hypothetical protein
MRRAGWFAGLRSVLMCLSFAGKRNQWHRSRVTHEASPFQAGGMSASGLENPVKASTAKNQRSTAWFLQP